MRYEEAGCYLEVDVATGNIERVAIDPEVMKHNLQCPNIGIREACGGFCQHSLRKCLRIED
jgi:hypothetical protein